MSCEVASVLFQAQVYYVTLLIDFDHISILLFRNSEINAIIFNLISYSDDKILKTLSYLNAIMNFFSHSGANTQFYVSKDENVHRYAVRERERERERQRVRERE